MTIQRWSDNIWIAQLADDPAFADDVDVLLADLGYADAMPHVVLDVSAVTHINSSNLSQMLRLRKLAIDKDVKLVVVGPHDAVWAAFLATGLDKVFTFAHDSATALAQLQMGV